MIKVHNLTHSFGAVPLFEDFSFEINDGIHALMGKSGSGKTTLIRILAELEKPQNGSVIIDKPVCISFQENRLFPWYTALKNVEIVSDRSTATKILTELMLSDSLHKYPSELSGGMKRRVSLARALSSKSKTILLDEPFAGLDDETAENTMKVIEKYSQGKVVLISTHNNKIAEKLNSIIMIP